MNPSAAFVKYIIAKTRSEKHAPPERASPARAALAPSCLQCRGTFGSEAHHPVVAPVVVDEPGHHGIFPDRVPRTRAVPGVDHFGVRARRAGDPFQHGARERRVLSLEGFAVIGHLASSRGAHRRASTIMLAR